MQVRDQQLRVPRIGWLRLKGTNLYAHGQPVQARIRQEGTRAPPQWYAYLTYAVPADSVRTGAATGVLGLGRNVGQVPDSDGTLYPMTDLGRLEAKIARAQRLRARKRKGSVRARRLGGQLTTLRRKQKRSRDNDTHHISRALADKAHTLVAEELHTQHMTKSARGTQAQPGTHVKAKAGLNRSILASNWGQLAQRLRYKCGHLETVDPPVHQPDLPSLRACRGCQPAEPGAVSLSTLRLADARGSQCRAQHSGAVHPHCGPRDRGNCTARGVSFRDLDDP